jgi:hypothetical protein
MDRQQATELVEAAIARYDRSDDSTDRFFEDAWRQLVDIPMDALALTKPFLASGVPRERSAAAEIIGRVGEAKSGSITDECYQLLFQTLVHETDADVRDAIASGVGLIWHSRDDDTPLDLANHRIRTFAMRRRSLSA